MNNMCTKIYLRIYKHTYLNEKWDKNIFLWDLRKYNRNMPHHDSRVFPLGQLVQNPKQVDAAEAVSPAVGRSVADLQSLSGQLRLLSYDA